MVVEVSQVEAHAISPAREASVVTLADINLPGLPVLVVVLLLCMLLLDSKSVK